MWKQRLIPLVIVLDLGWDGGVRSTMVMKWVFLVFALFLSQFPFEITNFSLVQRYRYFLSFTLKG